MPSTRFSLTNSAIFSTSVALFTWYGISVKISASADGSYLGDVLAAIIPQSVGMGLTFVPITLIATTTVADEDVGLASGLFNTAQQVGGALGLPILSTHRA